MKIARGYWQRWVWEQMQSKDGCPHPVANLRGAAKDWNGRYCESFRNMIARAVKDGWHIGVIPGPRGGTTGPMTRFIAREDAGDV